MATKWYPPGSVKAACRDGIRLYLARHGGRGLMPDTIEWAGRIVRGEPVSEEKIRKMGPWFARHAVDIKPDSRTRKTPGWVAWQLWGGYAGRRWAKSVMREIERR